MRTLVASLALALALVPLGACGGSSSPDDEAAPSAPAAPPSTGDPVADMRAAAGALLARDEHGAPAVEVQHILISFAGSGTAASRSREEAEQLAAELFARIQEGADFDELVREHTDDSAPGIYPMTSSRRRSMVTSFGDVGWRLAVGEVGVALHDPQASPYGWHIIKRLK